MIWKEPIPLESETGLTGTPVARPLFALSSLVLLLAVACEDVSTAPAESLEADGPPAVERLEVPRRREERRDRTDPAR